MTTCDGNHYMHPTTWQEANGAVLCVPGMTIRQYFAAMAMRGILSCGGGDATPQDGWDCTTFAQMVGRDAVKYADALIEALNAPQEAK